jgi:hypothetical protein
MLYDISRPPVSVKPADWVKNDWDLAYEAAYQYGLSNGLVATPRKDLKLNQNAPGHVGTAARGYKDGLALRKSAI